MQVLGGAGRYSVGGYGRLAEACADYVVEKGGAYLSKQRVKRILVEDGRAVGIEADGAVLRAAAIVSTESNSRRGSNELSTAPQSSSAATACSASKRYCWRARSASGFHSSTVAPSNRISQAAK